MSGLWRTVARRRKNPAGLMKALNDALVARKVEARYVTLLVMLWHPHSLRFEMANAGAIPPMVCRNGEIIKLRVEGVPLGLLTSTVVMTLCRVWLTPEDFLDWGWRVPFYLSGLLIAVGLLIRLRILETPLFVALQEQNQLAEDPLRETLRKHWREILLAAGGRIAENACFYLFSVSVIVIVSFRFLRRTRPAKVWTPLSAALNV